ncbi:glycosyltransferase family 2 protein [Cadophora sp. DSE1049]|nr:glycosyltransferase family 2 protein [Cadophora sp. DSE1049]
MAVLQFQLSLLPAATLYFMWVWGLVDYYFDKYYSSKYKPAIRGPLTRTSKSVSVVVRTLQPPLIFKECLLAWMQNKPLEIIISTTMEHIAAVNAIVKEAIKEMKGVHPRVLTIVSAEGARKQLLAGVLEAEGEIIATSDNHILWGPQYLDHMLPCFDDPRVGAAGPQITVNIPKERQHPDKITKWEVAGTRLIDRASCNVMMLVAAQWVWILPGTTCMIRSHLLKNDEFTEGYLNDTWNGVLLDVGEDTWVSRYILRRGYIITMQKCQETNVARTIKKTAAYVQQVLRWERSTIQSYFRTVTEVPQMYKHFLIVFKTWERLLKTPIILIHLFAWFFSLYYSPLTTFCFLSYYAYYKYKDVSSFLDKYRYMRKYWWVVVVQDFSGLYFNLKAMLTLSDASWERGEGGRKVL